ncbi:hypothetical protein ACP4OV_019991 [Aristida adscensionis]
MHDEEELRSFPPHAPSLSSSTAMRAPWGRLFAGWPMPWPTRRRSSGAPPCGCSGEHRHGHAGDDDTRARSWADELEEGPELPPDHPCTVRARRIAGDIIAAARDGEAFAPGRLLPSTRIRRAAGGVDFKVDAIDADVFNAYCCPHTGEIKLYSRLITALPKDGDLAMVVAHEVAHVMARHDGLELLKKLFLAGVLANLATELLDVPGEKIPQELFVRPYHFQTELEADRIGLLLLAAAGYDPGHSPAFWFRQRDAYPEPDGYEHDLAATHPKYEKRGHHLSRRRVMGEAMKLYGQAVSSGNGDAHQVVEFVEPTTNAQVEEDDRPWSAVVKSELSSWVSKMILGQSVRGLVLDRLCKPRRHGSAMNGRRVVVAFRALPRKRRVAAPAIGDEQGHVQSSRHEEEERLGRGPGLILLLCVGCALAVFACHNPYPYVSYNSQM